MPYSEDFRKGALRLAEELKNIAGAARILQISEKTIREWKKIKAATGRTAPIINYQKGHSHKFKNYSTFKEYVDKNNGKTTEEYAEYFTTSKSTIKRAFKAIGYTRKKRLSIQRAR